MYSVLKKLQNIYTFTYQKHYFINFCCLFLKSLKAVSVSLISKFMTSQPGKQTVAIHILPNISRSKANQTMKFGHLIEYNMRNIFPENSYTKCGGETISRPFPGKSKLSISLYQ